MKADKDFIIFESTGRKEYANCGIVGIDDNLEPSEGYDGGFEHGNWSPEEKKELAEYMILRWKRFGGLE